MPNQPLTPAQAIAQLKQELPAFAKTIPHVCTDYEEAWTAEFKLTGVKLTLEKAETDDYGKLDPIWCLELKTPCLKVSADGHLTLPSAIAALKQSAAKQMSVLGLVAEERFFGSFYDATKKDGESYQAFLERHVMQGFDALNDHELVPKEEAQQDDD